MVLMTNEQGYYKIDKRNTLINLAYDLWSWKIVVIREQSVSEPYNIHPLLPNAFIIRALVIFLMKSHI